MMIKNFSRLIGRYSQSKDGPLLVAIGGMHGNEPAGVLAIEEVLRRLHQEEEANLEFNFFGSFIGILGNIEALKVNQRYIDQDLNRSWSYESYKNIKETPTVNLNTEQKQILDIIEELRKEIQLVFPKQIYVLDLHTTSAYGGIFSLSTDDEISIKMALELHAPVIKGMLQGINDSSIHFFHGQNMGIPTTAIGFECGQHQDPNSIKIGVAAIFNCMRTIGSVNRTDVSNVHDELLINFSKHLPKINKIVGKYSIKSREHFAMIPGFKSFDKVVKGQHLADDIDGKVLCPYDARLLMPLYQKKGSDGFFLIQEE
jgi:succinylglutamate desuccinylase